MEDAVKSALETMIFKAIAGSGGSGSISSGSSYITDHGSVFLKINHEPGAQVMFDGEMTSLQTIQSTNTVRVPRPIKVVTVPEGSCLVMEHLALRRCNSEQEAKLGQELALLHSSNAEEVEKVEKDESRVTKSQTDIDPVLLFGFDKPTCCGYLPLNNTWADEWKTFYIRQRIQPQIERLITQTGDRDLTQLSDTCILNIDKILSKIPNIRPALLHGDLWSGNFGACDEVPVIYDPASFYGHSEFDFGIARMFGGFGRNFYESYHRLLPKSEGFEERADVYELFHHLNHWNHFGSGYKGSSIKLIRNICRLK